MEEFNKKDYETVIFSLKNYSQEFFLSNKTKVVVKKKRSPILNFYDIFNFIKKEKPEIIISNFSYVNPATLSAKILGVNYRVIWFHTLQSQLNSSARQIRVKSFFMTLSNVIVSNSDQLKREISKVYKQNVNKIVSIPFTTNLNKIREKKMDLSFGENDILIGCPGRFHISKNQILLLKILKIESDLNLKVLFAGSGNKKMITDNPSFKTIKDKVIFTGELNRNEIKYFYKNMDLIVLPSLDEAFGIVFIEALSLGCKTLVSKKFGALDFIDENVEFLTFDPKDENDLLIKIQKSIKNPSASDRYIDLYLKYFSMDEIFAKFYKFIKID
jgi:glycosyltransferase involved in cell wall biosynthesis